MPGPLLATGLAKRRRRMSPEGQADGGEGGEGRGGEGGRGEQSGDPSLASMVAGRRSLEAFYL